MRGSDHRLLREELVAHRGFVRALARRLVLDPDRADDVAQETLLAALAAPPRDRGALRGWLARVARNVAYRMLRDDERRRRREARRARPDRERPTGDVVADLQLHREVVDALLALDEPYRSTLVLHFFDDLPPRAIAARTGTKGTTVRTHLKRGIERLRRVLDERHGGDR
ncbi:MAG: RNA polymerase sigma factor, partial [Planctomycetota bacterium]